MRVSIPDDVAEELQAALTGRQTLEQVVELRLRAGLHAETGAIVLSQEQANALAVALGTGLPIATAAELLRQCHSVGQIHLQSTRLQFTPPQLSLIAERAQKAGDTTERFVARLAAKLMTEHFLIQPAQDGVFYDPRPIVDWEDEAEDPNGALHP